jgi:ketosteroid isomerase-like protein
MTKQQLIELSENFLEAWNKQDVEKVASCYTEDVIYSDPNTRGSVNGGDSMRRYLAKLFATWKMHWELREVYPFCDTEGCALLWHATIAKAGGEKAVEIDGMDLVLLENGLIKRNDVYFDRGALASLL